MTWNSLISRSLVNYLRVEIFYHQTTRWMRTSWALHCFSSIELTVVFSILRKISGIVIRGQFSRFESQRETVVLPLPGGPKIIMRGATHIQRILIPRKSFNNWICNYKQTFDETTGNPWLIWVSRAYLNFRNAEIKISNFPFLKVWYSSNWISILTYETRNIIPNMIFVNATLWENEKKWFRPLSSFFLSKSIM